MEINPKAKDAMLRAVSIKGRAELLATFSNGIDQCRTVRRGLPIIVEILDDLIELLKTHPDFTEKLREELLKSEEGNLWNPEVIERIDKSVDKLKGGVDETFKQAAILTRSVRAIVKTQLTLAATVESLCVGMMIYGLGDTMPLDATHAAMKLGADGKEAIQAYAKQKFGDSDKTT